MRALLLAALCVLLAGCGFGDRRTVVLYTSQDQFYAEPILREFTRETGIAVRAVFDTESAKTAGLANRLRQEAAHPVCDLFWSNEEMHSHLLAAQGVFPPDQIASVGYRTRRLVVNTNLLPLAQAPAELAALASPAWKGKIVLAYPLYGTTRSHFVALRRLWGAERWAQWCEGLVANGAKVVDGNSMVVKLVGAGEASIGLTDSDDIHAGKAAGLPIEALPLSPEMLVIPNTIAAAGGPNLDETRVLRDYLASPRTIDRLIAAGAIEGREFPGNALRVDWRLAQGDAEEVTKILKGIFLRT